MHLPSHVDLWLAFCSQLQELCDRGRRSMMRQKPLRWNSRPYSEFMLSLCIGYMKFLFLKLFYHHFQSGQLPVPKSISTHCGCDQWAFQAEARSGWATVRAVVSCHIICVFQAPYEQPCERNNMELFLCSWTWGNPVGGWFSLSIITLSDCFLSIYMHPWFMFSMVTWTDIMRSIGWYFWFRTLLHTTISHFWGCKTNWFLRL